MPTYPTDANKPFLERAPWIIVIFAQRWRAFPNGARRANYYIPESVGIATGFLNRLLDRPASEKPLLLLVVGHPAPDAKVPVITKKSLATLASFR